MVYLIDHFLSFLGIFFFLPHFSFPFLSVNVCIILFLYLLDFLFHDVRLVSAPLVLFQFPLLPHSDMPRYIYKLFFFRASCFVLNHFFSFILVFIQQLMSSFVNSFHFFHIFFFSRYEPVLFIGVSFSDAIRLFLVKSAFNSPIYTNIQ